MGIPYRSSAGGLAAVISAMGTMGACTPNPVEILGDLRTPTRTVSPTQSPTARQQLPTFSPVFPSSQSDFDVLASHYPNAVQAEFYNKRSGAVRGYAQKTKLWMLIQSICLYSISE